MTSRDEILERIRAIERLPTGQVPRTYRRTGSGDVVELFCSRVSDYMAQVVRAKRSAVAIEVERALARSEVSRAVIPQGLPAPWRPRGIELLEDVGLGLVELDAVDAVVTGSTLAIAETGTVVLTATPAEGRRAISLVPDVHICVVEADRIFPTVPAGFDELGRTLRPVTFISGPSATSDIELNRVEGVHGPRRLTVVVVEG